MATRIRRAPSRKRSRSRKRRRSNTVAIARRLGRWAVKGTVAGTGATVRHGASTVGRTSQRAHAVIADRREERRLHGHRPVVRDLTLDAGTPGSGPLSLSQTRSHLLGLDQSVENARAEQEKREPRRIAWAHPNVHLPTKVLERLDKPLQLSRAERRQLSHAQPYREGRSVHLGPDGEGWGPLTVAQFHDRVTSQLAERRGEVEPVRAHPIDDPDPTGPVAIRPIRPARSGAGTATTAAGGPAVNEPKSIADLASPAIDPSRWQEELPAFFEAAVAVVDRDEDGVNGMFEYFRQAATPNDVLGPLNDVVAAWSGFQDAMRNAAKAAEEYASSVELPRFERVS